MNYKPMCVYVVQAYTLVFLALMNMGIQLLLNCLFLVWSWKFIRCFGFDEYGYLDAFQM
jgi:hypothetical protein